MGGRERGERVDGHETGVTVRARESQAGIRLLCLGGTISMRDGEHGAVPALRARELATYCPLITSERDISFLGGSEISFDVLADLAEAVAQAARDGVHGVVVTLGTDAIEEAAAWLTYCGPWQLPVVLTGSMLPGQRADSDARANLSDAAAVAGCAPIHQPLVVFAGRIYLGIEVVKVSGVERSAFDAPGRGPLGAVLAGAPLWYRREVDVSVTIGPPMGTVMSIPIVTAALNDDGELLQFAAERYPAVVVAANGAGNLPPAQSFAVLQARRAGVLVVVVSRAPDALAAPLYGYPGGSATLQEAGVILASGFTPHRARLLVSLALSHGKTAQEVATLFL